MAKTSEPKRFHGENMAPREACVFECPQGAVQFALGEDANGRFAIEAYDGGISKHWYWGNFAIDLGGLTFASEPLPILDSHYTSERIGVSTEQKIGKKVTATGRFLGNAKAQELRKDMQDGFPMQASLSGRPGVIEQVEDGASVKVNGHTLKGPGAVWRKAVIEEISMCVFGALQNTRSTAFADNDTESIEFELLGDTQMSDKDKPALTVESFKAENPQLFAAIHAGAKAEGQAAEKTRFAALQKACGDDAVLAAECFAAGLTVADALTKRTEKLATENTKLREQLAAKPPASGTKPADKATAEFKEQPGPKTAADLAAEQFDEATATDDELKAHFAATPDVRDRFSSAQAYVAHVRHPAKK